MVKEIYIATPFGKITLQQHLKDEQQCYPTVLILTGDSPKGFSGASCQKLIPEFLNKNYGVVVFDFHGLGKSDGERKNLTLTRGMEDFKYVLDKFWTLNNINFSKTAIFATSFGATVALANSKLLNDFSVVILRSPCTFLPDAYMNEIGIEHYDDWSKNDYCELNGYKFDVIMDALNYNIYSEAKVLKVPCRIVYGECDEVVPLLQTKLLYSVLNTNKRISCINEANHGYSVGTTFEDMLRVILEWLQEIFQ